VSTDGADRIHEVVREQVGRRWICLGLSHAVKRAGEALDKVSRRLVCELREVGDDPETVLNLC
jgi:hypothetical protein